MQQTQTQTQAPAAPQPPQTATEIREQIRQQVQEAQTRIREGLAGQQAADPAGAQRTVISVPPDEIPDVPPRAAEVAIAFFAMLAIVVVLTPMARAMARRMDRSSATPRLPADASAQLNQLTQAVDAIALEVERISEGQRFTTKLLADMQEKRAALSAPPRELS